MRPQRARESWMSSPEREGVTMSEERPEYITCVRGNYVERFPHSCCGRYVAMELHYANWDHAASHRAREGRLLPCPVCMTTFPGFDDLVEKWRQQLKAGAV